MLTLDPNPTFDAQVKLTVPGASAPATVGITFKYQAKSQLDSWLADIVSKPDAEALADVVIGWSEIAAPFTPENLGKLLDKYPASGRELLDAYFRNLVESRVKN